MSKCLVDYLKEIPDPRQPKGRHHELWQILLIIIMGIMSGNLSYQGLGRFAERHRRSLIKQLGIKQGTVPSYSTMRRLMMEIDEKKLNAAFNTWASEQAIRPGEAIAGDGKSLRNTVSNCDSCQQNFMSMVSLFSQQQGLVVATAIMENKLESEIKVMQQLLKKLKLEKHLLTLDALHCQKKQSRQSLPVITTTSLKSREINQNSKQPLDSTASEPHLYKSRLKMTEREGAGYRDW